MNQWLLLFRKEMLEMMRNYKWIWVPLVFIALGAMEPLTSYYMPQILEAAGGLPEGTVIEIPPPSPEIVLVSALSQFGLLGLLVLVLACMGTVSSERESGSAVMILVKPVRHSYFITAKWAAYGTLTAAGTALGMAAAAYYTSLLIGPVALGDVIQGALVYMLWLLLVISLAVLYSTLMKSPGGAAFMTILTAVLLSTGTNLAGKWAVWSPARLGGHAATLISSGQPDEHFVWALAAAVLLQIAVLAAAVILFKRKEWHA